MHEQLPITMPPTSRFISGGSLAASIWLSYNLYDVAVRPRTRVEMPSQKPRALPARLSQKAKGMLDLLLLCMLVQT